MKDLSTLPVRIYSPLSQSFSLPNSIQRAGMEIWQTRWVLWSLFLRDFLSQYRQKLFGYLWTLINPVIGIMSFVFLYSAGILRPGELTIPYPLYVFMGIGLWGIFTGVIQSISGSLQSHGDLMVRTGIPKITLALSGLANILYGLLIQLLTLLILLVWFGIAPSWGVILFPFLLLPLFAIGIGVGLFLGVLSVVARDINSILGTFFSLLMYLTPVVYIANFDNPVLKRLVKWNPLTYLIDCPRNAFFSGNLGHETGFAVATLFSLLVLILGLHAFYLIQDKIAERI